MHNDFHRYTTKTLALKSRIDNLEYIKLKFFYRINKIIEKMEKPTEKAEIFSNYMCDKEPTSKAYKV